MDYGALQKVIVQKYLACIGQSARACLPLEGVVIKIGLAGIKFPKRFVFLVGEKSRVGFKC